MSDLRPDKVIRRIIVALDASPDSEAALQAAARVCKVFDATLTGIYVEDDDLLRVSELPFSREIRRHTEVQEKLSHAVMTRQMRLQQFRAARSLERIADRLGVEHEFRVSRGRVATALLREAAAADLITVGQSGLSRSSRGKLGSTARAMAADAPGAVLIARQGLRLDLPVVLLFDTDAADRHHALDIATQLASIDLHSPLTVLVTGGFETFKNAVAGLNSSGERMPRMQISRVNCEVPEQLAEQVQKSAAGMLVLPGDSRIVRPDRLARIAALIPAPILIARPPQQE